MQRKDSIPARLAEQHFVERERQSEVDVDVAVYSQSKKAASKIALYTAIEMTV